MYNHYPYNLRKYIELNDKYTCVAIPKRVTIEIIEQLIVANWNSLSYKLFPMVLILTIF